MELALVLLPLFVLLLGIVEFGRVYYLQLRLQQAARDTAREIALHYDDPGLLDLSGLITDTLNDGLAGVVDDVGDLSATQIIPCSTSILPGQDQDAVVTLQHTVSLALPLPDTDTVDWGAIPITGHARMSCEG